MVMSAVLRFFSVLWVVIALFSNAAAAADYTIRDVQVSATAEDATTARMEAMAQAESLAFSRLLEQSVPAAQVEARKASIPAGTISSLVTGYDVRDEKISARSYSAVMDVTFNTNRVNALLAQGAAPAASTGGAPVKTYTASSATHTLSRPAGQPAAQPAAAVENPVVLVLPVYAMNGRAKLWEEDNLWRAAWNRAHRSDPQLLRLPIGDQSDKVVLPDARQASSFGHVSTLAQRYQAGTVMVVSASETVSSAGVRALQVGATVLSPESTSQQPAQVYELQAGETVDTAMERVAQSFVDSVTEQRQRLQSTALENAAPAQAQPNPAAPAMMGQITVLSRLNAAADWAKLRKRLLAVSSVEQVRLSAISNHQADVVVQFRGSLPELEAAMTASGLQVSKTARYWVVAF